MKDYEKASGKHINFMKSSLQFGHKVPDSGRLEVQQVLGITTIRGIETYLGNPESLGGSKTKIFDFLYERVNNWTIGLITKGGKEVLIKSVASAMLTHVMFCFHLPKTVTKKLTSVVAHFWWSGSGNNKNVHWFSLDKLCKDKNEGGISFRDLQHFNTALLAKQLWRLLDKPNLCSQRFLKEKTIGNQIYWIQ